MTREQYSASAGECANETAESGYCSASGYHYLTARGEDEVAAAEREAAAEWDAAVALYRATPAGPDGDERYTAVAKVHGGDLAEYVMSAVEKETVA